MAELEQIPDQLKSFKEQRRERIQKWAARQMSLEDHVVAVIHAQFEKMSQKCKPRRYGANNESTEWTVLAGIAIVNCKSFLLFGLEAPEG